MQIRCAHCTKTLALAATGELPASCPHCAHVPGPGALGPYEPLRLLAAGGMGEVYLARHCELGTEVAIKVLPALPHDQIVALRERFAREARLTARVQHPGVVKVHGCDVAGDRPYLVLEYVPGNTLRQRLHAGPLPVVDAARFAAATADVLDAAHALGVLHRDIKPDNVMVDDDGAVRVLDFGIARGLADDAPLTRTGEIVGTPEYMAPEQLLDGPEAVTEHTDVHALGVLLFELLTGRSPFHGANVFQALKLVESLTPPPPSSLRPGVPAALDAVVARALQKHPHERFATAAAFAAAVRTAVPAAARPPTAASGPTPRRFFAALAAGIVITAVGTWLVLGRQPPANPTPELMRKATLDDDPTTVARWLHDGHWLGTLAAALDPGTSPELATGARQAFACTQLAWPLAADAPPWLAFAAERQRARWFPSGEDAATGPDDFGALFGARGAAPDAPRGNDLHSQRCHLLACHLARPDDGTLLRVHADSGLLDDALSRLLRIRLLPADSRADAFDEFARTQPLDRAEHWLARTIEHHRRGDRTGGTQAAELAWLSGAGELAVLLDGWLQMAPIPSAPQLRRLPRPDLERLRKRLAGGDATDAPAGVLLLTFVDALHGLPIETTPLRAVPDVVRAQGAAWFVATAVTHPTDADPLLVIAAALGTRPDYTRVPWLEATPAARTTIDVEHQRGR